MAADATGSRKGMHKGTAPAAELHCLEHLDLAMRHWNQSHAAALQRLASAPGLPQASLGMPQGGLGIPGQYAGAELPSLSLWKLQEWVGQGRGVQRVQGGEEATVLLVLLWRACTHNHLGALAKHLTKSTHIQMKQCTRVAANKHHTAVRSHAAAAAKAVSQKEVVPVRGTEAWEGILDTVGAQHISNLAEKAVSVIPKLGHVYTLARTGPP